MNNQVLAAALGYAERGWQVFPCHSTGDSGCACTRSRECSSPGKHPRTRRGLHDATTSRDQLRRWFAASPEANVGIRTGADSGLIVVDIDPSHGGHDTWQRLTAHHGAVDTYTVVTGGGGAHHYLQHPGRHVRNSAGMLGPGVDIRGDGGYVIAPPSRHAVGARYELVDDAALAPAPRWLIHALQPAARPAPNRDWINAGSPDRVVDRWISELRRAPEGTRNDTLNRVAFIVGRVAGDRGEDAALQARLVHEAIGIGLGEREARRTAASGFDAGVRARGPSIEL